MGPLSLPIRAPRALRAAACLAVALASLAPAFAGSLPVTWIAATDTDLAGYKVFYGTAPGSYASSVDVGKVTATTLTGLNDCTHYYIAIKAYDASGNQSASYSNEISGMASTTIASTSPSSSERGQSLTVTVNGANFDAGAAVSFSDPRITVVSTTVVSCTQVRAQISVAADAALGAASLDVTNSDRTFATRASALSVLDVTVPATIATAPAAGATGVALAVQPTVSFSEAMDPASITASSVQLLLPDGSAVAQGAGSPSLDPTGRIARIVPAAGLGYLTSYRVRVVAGASGARDLQGTPVAATFTQTPGFTTIAAPAPTVSATTPAGGATGVSVSVQPTATFSLAMDPSTITAASVKLLRADGTAVAQAAGSPSLDPTGTIARIVPASDLANASTYRVQIVGGAGGAAGTLGSTLASTFTQSPGFTTVAGPVPPTVTGTSPASGATSVALAVQPTVTFSEAMQPATITAANVRLLLADGTAVAQASGSPSLDPAGTLVRIVPTSPLAYGTTYRIQIAGGAGGAADASGTALASTFTQASGFTTVSAPVAPTVTGTTPASGATSVAPAVQPTVTFSHAMDAATITAGTVRLLLADGTPVAQASGSPSLDAGGTTARIVPASALANATTYKIQVLGGAGGAADTLGTQLATSFLQPAGFTTIAAPIGPTVVTTSPASGTTSVPVTVQPTITFTTAMDPATISRINVRLIAADGTPVAQGSGSPTLDVTGKVARIMPAGLLVSTTPYRIQIIGGPGGAADAQGNVLASTWLQPVAFTTVDAGDTIPPVLVSATPSDGTMDVPVSFHPTVLFNEALKASSVTVSSVQLLRADGSGVPQAAGSPSLDAAGTTVTIVPAAPLSALSAYRVKVIGGSLGVADVAGNVLVSTYVMAPGFTTLDATTPPVVQSTNPNDGSTDASSTVTPAVLFNKPLNRASVGKTTVLLVLADGSAVLQAAGSPSLDAAGTTATIIPASPLTIGTHYFVRVIGGAGGIKDTSGLAMTSTFSQPAGFQIKAPPGKVNNLHRKDGK